MKKSTFFLAKTLVLLSFISSVTAFSQSKPDMDEADKGFIIFGKVLEKVRENVGASKEDFRIFQSFYGQKIDNERGKFFSSLGSARFDEKAAENKMKDEETRITALYNQFVEVRKEYPSSVEEFRYPAHRLMGTCDSSGCTNINFEQGTLNGWNAFYGYDNNSSGFPYFNVTDITGGPAGAVTEAANDAFTSTSGYYNAGIGPNPSPDYQISITSGARGDALVPTVPVVSPFGGKYSAMVGDSTLRNYGVAILSKTFLVNSSNDNFTYQYAVFLENPVSHSYYQQPFFKVAVLDELGDTIPFCGEYTVVSKGGLPGFTAIYYPPNGDSVYYKNWTVVDVPLKKYIGQCVTVVFESGDCGLGGHFGYAYVSASCAPLGVLSSSPALCGQKTITVTAPPGFAGYLWSGPTNGIVGADSTQNISVDSAGTYTVVLTPVTGASCADTLSITIGKAPGPPPTANFTADTVCAGQATTFNNKSNPITGKFYWDFYNTGTFEDSTVNPTWTYAHAGTYFVKLYENNNGCGADTILKVIVDSSSIASFTAPSVCLGQSVTFTNNSVGATSYAWNFGDPSSGINNTSTLTNPSHTYGSIGTYTVVLVTKIKGSTCADTAKEVITVSPIPVPNIVGNHNICACTNTVLTASGGSTYSWAPGGGTTASITVKPCVNTVYTVTVSNGVCTATDTFAVIVTPLPVVTVTGATNVCQNDSVTLSATGGGVYEWSNKSTNSSITVLASKDSTYYVVVTKGCADTTFHTITVIPVKGITACCDTTIAPGTSAGIGASGAVGYVWSPSGSVDCYTCPVTNATPSVTTTYTVVGTDSNGCKSYAEVTITLECTNYIIPNVFTPNGDGKNDAFLIKAFGTQKYSIEIYDRWGVKVFQSDDPSTPWNGKINNTGGEAPTGVYYYILKSNCNNVEDDHHGFLQLIRGQ